MNTRTGPRAHPDHVVCTGALEYHRLAIAGRRRRWWKPLLVGLVALGAYAVVLAACALLTALAGLVVPGVTGSMDRAFSDAPTDVSDPTTYAIVLIAVALMLPAVLAATAVLGAKPVGLVSSVAGRIRWGWLLRCLGIAAVIYAMATPLGFVASSALAGESLAPRFDSTHTLALLGLALVLVPFQAAAEEYVFRGYLMQTLGAWFGHPAIAIAVPVPLFVLGHDYELLGMIDIAAFGLAAGWLTWRTGGLEAAIALHIVNNVVISAVGAFGFTDLNAKSATPVELIVSLLMTSGFAIAAVTVADRTGVERTRSLNLGSVVHAPARRGADACRGRSQSPANDPRGWFREGDSPG